MAATASSPRSDPADELCLVTGDGTSKAWPSPPLAMQKLLQELFVAQPAEGLTWVHHAVWRLQEYDIKLKIQREGGTITEPLSAPPMLFGGSSGDFAPGDSTSSHEFNRQVQKINRKSPSSSRGVETMHRSSGPSSSQKRTTGGGDRGMDRRTNRAQTEPSSRHKESHKDEVMEFHSEDPDIENSDDDEPHRKQTNRSEIWDVHGELPNLHAVSDALSPAGAADRKSSMLTGIHSFLRMASTCNVGLEVEDRVRSMSVCSHHSRLSHSEEIVVGASPVPASHTTAAAWATSLKMRDNEMKNALTNLPLPANVVTRRGSAPPPLIISRNSLDEPVVSRSRHNSLVVDPVDGSVRLAAQDPIATTVSSRTMSIGARGPQHSSSLNYKETPKAAPESTWRSQGSITSNTSSIAASAINSAQLKPIKKSESNNPKKFLGMKRKNSKESNWIKSFTGMPHDASTSLSAANSINGSNIDESSASHCDSVMIYYSESSCCFCCNGLFEDVSMMTWPRLFWESLWLICVLYELWQAVFMVVFWTERSFPDGFDFRSVGAVVLAFFCLDILLNFATAFKEHGEVIYNRRRIIDRYFKTWFFFDLGLVVSDFVVLVTGNSVKALQVFKLIRAIRLLRAWEDAGIILRYFGDKILKRITIHCCLLNLALLLLSHVNGAIWAAIQDNAWPSTATTAFDRYLVSLSRAHGEIISGFEVQVTAPSHWLFSIIVRIERATIITVCIYHMVRTVMIRGSSDVDEDHLEDDVLAFLKDRDVPSLAQMNVLTNVHEVCKARKLQRCFDLLQGHSMPMEIRAVVADMLWSGKLRSLGLICQVMDYHSIFARELALCTYGEFVPSRTVLFRSNEPSHAAYYVVSGVLEVKFTEDEEDPIDDYTSGMWAGEKAVVNFELRRGETVACKTLAELMVLSAMEFRRLLNRFDLSEVVEDLIKVNLWMGFCGRCGMFGDHFKRDCPVLRAKRDHRSVVVRFLTRRLTEQPERLVGKDLSVFLADYNLERLEQPMHNHGIHHLIHLNREKIEELTADPDVTVTAEEEMILNNSIATFRKKHATGAIKVLANTGDAENHLVFISHYKVEAGTEATLMQNDILQLLAEDQGLPGQDLASPVFLDSEDLQDLEELQEHVKRSHNLILLLTKGVLTRPWVLVEVVTAINAGVNILPVEIQRRDMTFEYPDEEYYKRLLSGDELDKSACDLLLDEGVEVEELAQALRQVFKRIAMPFSPHKTATVRKAELQDILKRCQIKKGRTSLRNAETIVQICRPKSDVSNIERLSGMATPRGTLAQVLPGQSPRASTNATAFGRSRTSHLPLSHTNSHAPSRRTSISSNMSVAGAAKSLFGKLLNTGQGDQPRGPSPSGGKSNLLQVDAAGHSHGYGIRMLNTPEAPSEVPSVSPSPVPGEGDLS